MIFLRPWFLLLALAPLIFWIFKKRLMAKNPLENFVDKRLLPFLTVHFNIGLYRMKMRWFVFFWTILSVAAAGPAFDKISVPATTQAPADVVVLDLSPAMTPENLTKAKLKLYDLLGALKGHQVGLVLYDEKGYTASPITQDIDVIRNMIPALMPSVMPRPLNKPVVGFQQAIDLLKNANMKNGHIIFITAGGFDGAGLETLIKNNPYVVSTLAIETSDEGYPIPLAGGDFMRDENGHPLLVKPNKAELSKIGTYIPMSVSDEDVRKLVSLTPNAKQKDEMNSDTVLNQATMWKDLGPYLLFLAIPFFIWLFRKGVFFALLIVLPITTNAGIFERPDQTIYRKTMSGIDAYRIGNYEAAKQVFDVGQSADDFYNAGNARAHLNDIQGAIQSYEKALQLNPNHVEAKFNKEYLERQMPPEQQNQDSQDNQDTQNDSEKNQEQQSSEQNQSETNSFEENATDQNMDSHANPDNSQNEMNNNDAQNQNEQSQSSESDQEQQMKQSQSESQEAQTEKQEELIEQPLEENKNADRPAEQMAQDIQENNKQFDQESEQLLNKIKQDPSRLLRYRLYQQYIRKP